MDRQRSLHRPRGYPLAEEALATLAPFFPAATLAVVRLAIVPRIRPPAAAAFLARLGLVRLAFDRLLGITFHDTIVVASPVRGPALAATLFHELVHVEQARQLGLRRFVRRYVGGWLETRDYRSIPLERDAYELQRRFTARPHEPFDVAAEVARRLASH